VLGLSTKQLIDISYTGIHIKQANFLFKADNESARLVEVLDLPTPPLPLVIVITFGFCMLLILELLYANSIRFVSNVLRQKLPLNYPGSIKRSGLLVD
jgi:hypothetical protein